MIHPSIISPVWYTMVLQGFGSELSSDEATTGNTPWIGLGFGPLGNLVYNRPKHAINMFLDYARNLGYQNKAQGEHAKAFDPNQHSNQGPSYCEATALSTNSTVSPEGQIEDFVLCFVITSKIFMLLS